MPEWVMCDHPNCRAARTCKRHAAGGTEAGPDQRYSLFGERLAIAGGKGIWPINRCPSYFAQTRKEASHG